MNADAFRHFYDDHFTENRKMGNRYLTELSQAQFTQPIDYSHGSVRRQLVYLMSTEEVWFSELRGLAPSESLPPANFEDRNMLRAHWDSVEQSRHHDSCRISE